MELNSTAILPTTRKLRPNVSRFSTKQRNPTLRYSIFVVNMGFLPEPTLFVFTYYGILPATPQRLEKQY